MKNIVLSIAMMASVSAFAQQKATIEIYPEKVTRLYRKKYTDSLPNILVHVYTADFG